jgi:Xaa-Pro aminopeptidase
MHGTSHWLGLDVHDVGAYVIGNGASNDRSRPVAGAAGVATGSGEGKTRPRPLEPGMAYTIEPGLYISADDEHAPEAFKGIGIRIEDDVVVTNDGILNLNRAIPKKPDEIEAWVRGEI